MKEFYKNIVTILVIFTFFTGIYADAATTTPVKKTATTVAAKPVVTYTPAAPLDIVENPAKYLNKNITFSADFVAFTSLGLDYKPAFRDGTKYIGILIKRPDVTNHIIPLSEMKMFISRDEAEKHIDLESGDKIKIEGKVFSNALGDPWIDISNLTVITQKNKTQDKK